MNGAAISNDEDPELERMETEERPEFIDGGTILASEARNPRTLIVSNTHRILSNRVLDPDGFGRGEDLPAPVRWTRSRRLSCPPETDGLDAEIDRPSLDGALPLSEIYVDVSFDSNENKYSTVSVWNLIHPLA